MHEDVDELLAGVITRLRAPIDGEELACRRVTAAVQARLRTSRPWWRRPRALGGLAAAASLLLAVVWRLDRTPAADVAAAPPSPATTARHVATHHAGWTPVTFGLTAKGVSHVAVVGDFNDWNPSATPLRRAADGTWHASVPLPPGRHAYAFVLDGTTWIADPEAPLAEASDFGQPTSVLFVGERRAP